MTAFLDIFEPIKKGDYGLTDQAIYWSIQKSNDFIPIWGGNQEHNTLNRFVSKNTTTKKGKPLTIFNETGIIISLDGSAGSTTFKKNQEFALNHHAGFIKIKNSSNIKLIPEYFALFYQNQFKETSVSDGSKTLSLEQIYSMDFDIPSWTTQEKIMSKVQPLLLKRNKIISIIEYIDLIKSKSFSHEYNSYQVKEIPISEVIDYLAGNSGLTAEEIYSKSQFDGKKYKILSGSTSKNRALGEIAMCKINNKELKTFSDKEGILVVRKGKAGTTAFISSGNYTINDDAYILFIKNNCSYQISLKWLMIQYCNTFLEYASSSDNGTWNMTGFFKNVLIDIPNISEQKHIVKKYETLEKRENNLLFLKSQIANLFMKRIV